MKGLRILAIALLSLVIMAFLPAMAENDASDLTILRLPLNLLQIEESAFERTGVTTVYIQRHVTVIGDYAFADIPELTSVYIPPSVTHIGKDAFSRSDKLTLYGMPGSEAEKWADRYKIKFVISDVWGLSRDGFTMMSSEPARHSFAPASMDSMRVKAMPDRLRTAPKERPEMYPIDYDFP